jgi:hypothetical protein
VPNHKDNARRVSQVIKNGLAQASYKDFFIITGFGMGMGLLMSFSEDIMEYTISLTIACAVSGTAFIMFALPRLLGSIKRPPSSVSIGDTIAIGEDGDRPRVSSKNKIRPVQPEF